MRKHHAQNEHIKRKYFAYLEEAMRMSKSSVDQIAASIAQFENLDRAPRFRAFHIEQARKFKRELAEAINPATGKPGEGDDLFAPDGPEGFFQVARSGTWLQVPNLFGCGLFQSIE